MLVFGLIGLMPGTPVPGITFLKANKGLSFKQNFIFTARDC
jgi:hypothetical protein